MIRCLSCGIPIPVSVTENATTDLTRLSTAWFALQPDVARSIRNRTVPCSVNFSALDSRFLSTCCSRLASVMIVSAGRFSDYLNRKVEALSFGDVAECAQTQVAKFGESYAAHFHVHLAGLDLTQVENVVDQGKQIGPR